MEHNATITVTVSQLKYAFEEFSKAVYQQKTSKMNYESWRRLKGITEKLGTIIPITFRPNGENCDGYKKYFVDCSKGGLGSYPITVPDKFIDLLQEIKADNANKINNTSKKADDKNVDDSSMTTSTWISNDCCTASSSTIKSTINDILGTLQNQTLQYNPSITTGPINDYTTTTGYYPYTNYPSNTIQTNIIQKEEEKTMNIPTMKFDFGPADSNSVAMSPYGLAIQYNGSWYAYNAKEDQTIDVTGMTFSFKNMIYKMPVAVNQIAVGDLIYHQKRPMYVIAAPEGASIKVIDLAASEQKTVIPVANMFGFNYVTKIAPLFNLGTITPSTDNPFGNIMPMMMMSSLFEDNKSDNDVMQMMLMMSLMNGNNPFAAMFAGGSSNAQ